jgi:eukaryotic-like serine/threonine-protein kinase
MPEVITEKRFLGRYELLHLLGQGGMGEVHLARLVGVGGFEKLCIVKTILPQMKADPQFVDRFHHEAKVLVHLNHSNIAQVYDMGEVDGILYMAIEYVPGVDLSKVLNRVVTAGAQVPLAVAISLSKQMCEALGYAHRKTGPDGVALGIVHRDVSPQNVMVSYEGECKVIDFGLAKSAARSKHTMPATVMGKLGYMSPEQAMARKVDYRSDIFSAGIVVWEMFAGRPLYEQGTMGEMVARMVNPHVPSLCSIRRDVSPELDKVVQRALAIDPSLRYVRCDEFSRALNEVAVREGLTVTSEELGNYVRVTCPQEFEAERHLQSKISMLRAKGPVDLQSEPTDTGSEGTFLRTPVSPVMAVAAAKNALPLPLAPEPSPVSQRPAIGMTVSEPLIIPRSKGPVFAVMGLLVALALAGVAYALTRSTPAATGPLAMEKPRETPSVPEKNTREEETSLQKQQPDEKPEAPKTESALEYIRVSDPLLKVTSGTSGSFVKPTLRVPLKVGDSLTLVGEANSEGKRPLYGTAGVIAVKGVIAELLMDEGGAPVDPVYAAKEAAPRPKLKAKSPPKPKSDPAPQVQNRPLPPPPAPVKTAPAPIVNSLPPSPLPAIPIVQAPPAPPPPAPTPVAEVRGYIRVRGISGARSVIIRSQSSMALTGCQVRLSSGLTAILMGAIPANQEKKLGFGAFRSDSGPVDPNFSKGLSLVSCREGFGYFETQYAR